MFLFQTVSFCLTIIRIRISFIAKFVHTNKEFDSGTLCSLVLFLYYRIYIFTMYNIHIYNKKVHFQHLYAVVLYSVECSQRNSLEEETVSVVAGFSEQCSVAPLEGKALNSLCAGCVGSAEILAALFLTLDLYKSWMEGGPALIILSAFLIIRCSLDLSCFVDEPNHTDG
ncbi:hypothetical protein CHARACLAT_025208 [Characodon lateralis]|uniref:Transmembrane protein n=1 Tax=Characodon lateralis TaxID=208331 RepID=A0ABU7DJN4_9TELE|nr:hypothetical protein [Characodon lateralis]